MGGFVASAHGFLFSVRGQAPVDSFLSNGPLGAGPEAPVPAPKPPPPSLFSVPWGGSGVGRKEMHPVLCFGMDGFA